MGEKMYRIIVLAAVLLVQPALAQQAAPSLPDLALPDLALPDLALPDLALPHLARLHGATQLIVDGKPFLVRGGELENSSASSPAYLQSVWAKLDSMNFNTAIAPVYWQLIEAKEGEFDFSTVDGLIRGAREHHLHLVLLWFGSWKNSMSSYVPDWAKEDQERFPRAALPDGASIEILSAFSRNNLDADSKAFAALMKHLREFDSTEHTVVMIQVENEMGMVPQARDYSAAANAAFASPVPATLTDYLAKHRDSLAPELRRAWESHGSKTGANWPDTFGAGAATDELFTAWSEARYAGEVAARGKAVYPLPMYVNAALVRPGASPGQYPSGGPLPHLFDIWRAAAPAIDFLAPDIYFPNFTDWAKKYALPDNPLFIPESGRAGGAQLAADAFFAYAQLDSMGFSVYAPEFMRPEDRGALAEGYAILDQLAPLILANQGTGRMAGLLAPASFDGNMDLADQQFSLGDYIFHARFSNPFAFLQRNPAPANALPHGGLVIQTDVNDFLVAGTGMILTFSANGNKNPLAGVDSIWEGNFVNGQWVAGRNMNGDEDNQGRFLRLPEGQFAIMRLRLYRYH